MTKLQKELPNAKILIISPNPNGKMENSLGMNCSDYIQASEKVITNDNIHPNDQGHYIWFEVMEEYFNLK
ncbi:hypothetical protein ABGT22_19165 [Peribacillus frigoritolerans]|uniref:hypothetical protein n=1 Tax=Peribacillus frigoritolerans TaxID=450367 RepID=UPI00345DFBE5